MLRHGGSHFCASRCGQLAKNSTSSKVIARIECVCSGSLLNMFIILNCIELLCYGTGAFLPAIAVPAICIHVCSFVSILRIFWHVRHAAELFEHIWTPTCKNLSWNQVCSWKHCDASTEKSWTLQHRLVPETAWKQCIDGWRAQNAWGAPVWTIGFVGVHPKNDQKPWLFTVQSPLEN